MSEIRNPVFEGITGFLNIYSPETSAMAWRMARPDSPSTSNCVPPGTTVVGVPGRIAEDKEKPTSELEHGKLPDPVAEAIRLVLKEQDKLEERLKRLETSREIGISKDDLGEERKELEKKFDQEDGI